MPNPLPFPSPLPTPHLFFSASDVPRLQSTYRDHEFFADLRARLRNFDRAAERVFLRSELQVNDHLSDLGRLGRSAEQMALTTILEQDEDAADLAIECVRGIMRFTTWDFFIDDAGQTIGSQRAPSSIIAVACVIDWLGDRVDADEKQTWLHAIAERGCTACAYGLHVIEHPKDYPGWHFDPRSSITTIRSENHTDNSRRAEITQSTNLRAVPACGLALGATVLARHGYKHPHLPDWFAAATRNLSVFAEIYESDGSYDEGVHYADYTSRSLIVGIMALQRAGVVDLRYGVNWTGHAHFLIQQSMATHENPHEVINISDNGYMKLAHVPPPPPETRSAVAFWIAREFRDPAAQWLGSTVSGGHNPWSLIFYDGTIPVAAPPQGPSLYRPKIDWLVARTGFEADDLVVSLRSGRGANHEHADRNSLIIKHAGEPLIVDPLRPPYSYADPSWLLRTTQGHSAMLVDGAGRFHHNGLEGTNATPCIAHVMRAEQVDGHAIIVSDASHAYRLRDIHLKSVVRGVVINYAQAFVIVVDRVTRWKGESVIEARFFADNWADQAKLSTHDHGFTIERPRARAVATVFCRDALTLRTDTLPIPADRAKLHPFVAVTTPAVAATTLVTVIALPGTTTAVPAIAFNATSTGITVSIAGAPDVHIDDQADLPLINLAG